MSKQFVKGNTYVFTTKKFKADVTFENASSNTKKGSWIAEINGQIVDIKNRKCREYSVTPQWCKCIKQK